MLHLTLPPTPLPHFTILLPSPKFSSFSFHKWIIPLFTPLFFLLSLLLLLLFLLPHVLFLFLSSTASTATTTTIRRRRRLRHNNRRRNQNDGVVLPRVIFVAENDVENNQPGGGNDSAVLGLDQIVINSYPKFQFNGNNDVDVDSVCSICLCEYKDSEMLRMMPECHHCFHVSCLDSWLKLNGSCPVCRNSPMPTPLPTPLQEVVPLSLYAADRRGRS
ncbi:RING-H2 finger protein ATL67 [Arachis ipaensis]|uniref:RING-H2 finger protein ATL67 n=1 Tax=Arachis ipaensis TaxID=130454 RepID=UPI0007AF9D10|nr:RING-H2 finger protein ATL67 [Arachis ipaensis]